MKHIWNLFFMIITFLVLLSSCDKSNKQFIPDIEHLDLELNVNDVNTPFFKIEDSLGILAMTHFFLKYPLFARNYVGMKNTLDSALYQEFKAFKNDPKTIELLNEQQQQFPQFDVYKTEFETTFKYFQHYFPNKILPEIDFFFTGFAHEILAIDSIIVISPEFFFGADYKYLSGYYDYQKRRFEKEYIVPKVIYEYSFLFQKEFKSTALLAKMIYFGKAYYFCEKLLPYHVDSLVIGYPQSKLEWCVSNEAQIWAFLTSKKLLFDEMEFRTKPYLIDGPRTNQMPKDSPGRIGHWVGLQIVRKYMIENPNITLPDLMAEQDFMKIFNGSKYKPRR